MTAGRWFSLVFVGFRSFAFASVGFSQSGFWGVPRPGGGIGGHFGLILGFLELSSAILAHFLSILGQFRPSCVNFEAKLPFIFVPSCMTKMAPRRGETPIFAKCRLFSRSPPRELQECPRRVPRRQRWPQDSPKMAPRWPQDGSEMAPRWPRDGAKMVPEAPRLPKMASRRLQEGQDGPKLAPRWPKDGPKMAQRWPQDGPRVPLMASRRFQES